MNFKHIIPTLALTLLLAGCGNAAVTENSDAAPTAEASQSSSTDSNTSVSTKPTENESTTASTEAPVVDPNVVTREELDEFTALFNTPEYNGFLTKSFSNTSQIDWDVVVAAGGGINAYNEKDGETEEVKDYQKLTNYDFFISDHFVIVRRPDLEDFALKHTGEALNSDRRTLHWTYMDKYDSFYNYHWSYEDKEYKCVSGQKDGNDYTLRFQMNDDSHIGRSADRIVTLTKDVDGLVVKSNAIQWDEGCDPDQTFDIDLNDNGDTLRFVTYKGYSSAARFILTKDGNEVATGTLSGTRNDKLVQIKDIAAIGFFDFNADGRKDIVCIGDSDDGRHLTLFESVDSNYYYEQCEADEAIEKMIDGDITLGKIKKALLGNNTDAVYNTYNEAYAQVAKLYNLANSEYDYAYGLVDGNGDAIPELIINGASSVSLFTFENGHIHCLMQKWGWGAMGNYGYEYAPGKNVYLNENSDYAGAIRYAYFMMPREGQEIVTSYYEKTNFFEDKDKDGVPSDEELDANKDMSYSESFYYNCTAVDMSQEEVESKVNELWNYEYKQLRGDADYEGLITVLKNS
ncbi:MAG: hypothetical protein IJI01_06735 [Butyrivibrio sp.]|uniref:hypothetical protein n=1 Tax=Butyrivibrio sp. TaxID=28121 RepID=UPI0025BFD124|nr:hypothetical protein [Butyrivibrio sp.]MBQ6588353.1 hypothetical protein [Butyrivibrio sp.]